MAGTKRKKTVTNAKTSAHSKQHKPSTSSSSAGNKKSHSKSTAGAASATTTATKSKNTSAFDSSNGTASSSRKRHGAAPVRDAYGQTKKERKGKGPAYIPVVKGQDSSQEDEDEQDSDEDDLYGDEDGGMEVDDDLADPVALGSAASFLTRLDEKGMSA